MPHSRKAAFATVFLSVALSGCAAYMPPPDPIADLKTAKLDLTCGIACSLQWSFSVGSIHALDMSERWPELAGSVMKIGYGNDLAYYYLGQAAQGLGYHEAAISYYTYALSLSNGTDPLMKCEPSFTGGADTCQGVNLAMSIPPLIQASRNALAPPPPPPVVAPVGSASLHHHHPKKAPAPQPPGSGLDTPPPPASDSGLETPPPPSTR